MDSFHVNTMHLRTGVTQNQILLLKYQEGIKALTFWWAAHWSIRYIYLQYHCMKSTFIISLLSSPCPLFLVFCTCHILTFFLKVQHESGMGTKPWRDGNGCFGSLTVGVVFEQTEWLAVTNRDPGLGLRDEVEKGCGFPFIIYFLCLFFFFYMVLDYNCSSTDKRVC